MRSPSSQIAVPASTNQMYDVFAYDNSGAVALELTSWTNDTTRATALVLQNGVYSKTGALTRRYLGSFRTTGVSGQTEDSLVNRLVWNYYNRVPRRLQRFETNTSWTYTTATWRQARASTANQVEVVTGVAEVPVVLHIGVVAANNTGGVAAVISSAIGLDSTTAPTTNQRAAATTLATANATASVSGMSTTTLTVGYHFLAWLEYGNASGVTTWYSASGIFGLAEQSGLSGWIDG